MRTTELCHILVNTLKKHEDITAHTGTQIYRKIYLTSQEV